MIPVLFLKKPFALALAIFCLAVPVATAGPKAKAAGKWVEHKDVKLSVERQMDGDSFGMEVQGLKGKPTTRTYRLYGTDGPESDAKDKLLEGRIKEQAEYFGLKPEEIPLRGKQAAAFTLKLLTDGKPRLWTRGTMGQKVPKNDKRPQRYYALVEVTAPDGKRRWLHELLLEAGLARAHGEPAAWPPAVEDRQGEKAACEKFAEQLGRLEKAAKHGGRGVWGRVPAVK